MGQVLTESQIADYHRDGFLVIPDFADATACRYLKARAEEILHAEALRQFNHFLESRRMRLFSVNAGLPASMWYVMILGAILNLAICWFFDMRFITQLVLGAILAAYLGLMMFLIFDMNQPFRGDVSISAEPFAALFQRMNEE